MGKREKKLFRDIEKTEKNPELEEYIRDATARMSG
jgi:hypothetical protein